MDTDKINCPYSYSNLVTRYYNEASQCLEMSCPIAAIAMSWAAVDYAIEHELNGGSKVNPITHQRREPVKFNNKSIKNKLT